MANEDTFYTVQEFAKLIKIHPSTVIKGIKKGRFQAFKIGGESRSDYRICSSEPKRLCELDMSKLLKEMVDTAVEERLGKKD